MPNILNIQNLQVSVNQENIIKGVNLTLAKGKIHVLMGPNGSGKSTLAQVLMGNPDYKVTGGKILYEGKNLLKRTPHDRALQGLFLSFQYPSEIPGVTISSYLRMIYNKRFNTNLSPVKFRSMVEEKIKLLKMDKSVLDRYLNDGFSGGEKKKMEMLQMLILEPKLAILDEVDSGLDIDAVKTVASTINSIHKKTKLTLLIITHYHRLLKHIEPDKIYIMQAGQIVKSGGHKLAEELEEKGYAQFGK